MFRKLVIISALCLPSFSCKTREASNANLDTFASNQCPEANAGFVRGCIKVKAGPSDSETLRLFYQMKRALNPKRKTIFVLNGGPGGSLAPYAEDSLFRELENEYNVVFFDPRGVGRSSRLLENQLEGDFFEIYSTENNLNDIASLQKHLKVPRVILLGHSYGAHIALAYAATSPTSVEAVIDIAGALDSEGFLVQAHIRNEIIGKISREIGDEVLGALLQVVQAGEAVDDTGAIYDFSSMQQLLTMEITFYQGQTQTVKKKLQDLVNTNREKIDTILNAMSLTAESRGIDRNIDPLLNETINPQINRIIVCNELLTEEYISSWESGLEKDAAIANRAAMCPDSTGFNKNRLFDYKKSAPSITSPVLIFGGKFDPLIPLRLQERDYEILKQASNISVTLVEVEKAGHQIIQEARQCVLKHVLQFMGEGSTAQKYKCT